MVYGLNEELVWLSEAGVKGLKDCPWSCTFQELAVIFAFPSPLSTHSCWSSPSHINNHPHLDSILPWRWRQYIHPKFDNHLQDYIVLQPRRTVNRNYFGSQTLVSIICSWHEKLYLIRTGNVWPSNNFVLTNAKLWIFLLPNINHGYRFTFQLRSKAFAIGWPFLGNVVTDAYLCTYILVCVKFVMFVAHDKNKISAFFI